MCPILSNRIKAYPEKLCCPWFLLLLVLFLDSQNLSISQDLSLHLFLMILSPRFRVYAVGQSRYMLTTSSEAPR